MSKSWVDVQKKTFTRWANEFLHERMLEIGTLDSDLSDGWILINLLEVISSKKIGGTKTCKSKFQKMENLNRSLAFINSEGLKLVGIGAEDIHDGNTKLILGLLWTLILRYQINLGEGSPKWELLQWVKKQIEKYDVEPPRNFARDWTDGKVIFALADSLVPGTLTENRDMGAATGSADDIVEQSMARALEVYDIPRILDVKDMTEEPDELAVMTYISYYREWLSNEAQRRRAAEAEALRTATAENSFADGPGLEQGETCRGAEIYIHARNKFDNPLEPAHGGDDFKVVVSGPEEVVCDVTDKGEGEYETAYDVKLPGEYSIAITLGDEHIKDSPFTVRIVGPSAEHVIVTGEGVEGGSAKGPSEFKVEAFDADGTRATCGGDAFAAAVKGPDGEETPCELVDNNDGTWSGSYTPEAPGVYEVSVTLRDEHVKDSPFSALMENANAAISWAEGEGLEKAQATRDAAFVIHAVGKEGEACTEGGDPFKVDISGPSETEPTVKDNGDGTYDVTYAVAEPGDYTINVTLHGDAIKDAPFSVNVKALPDAGQSWAEGDGIDHGEATNEAAFVIHAVNKEGEACTEGGDEFKVTIDGPADTEATLVDNGDGTYNGTYTPEVAGDYTVHITYEDAEIKNAPFSVHIKTYPVPDQSHADGKGLEEGQATKEGAFDITGVQANGEPCNEGGDDFTSVLHGPDGDKDVDVTDNGDGTYSAKYTPTLPGDYTLDVLLRGEHVKDSPFSFTICPCPDPDTTYAEGKGLEDVWDNEPAVFTIHAIDLQGNPRTEGGDVFVVKVNSSDEGELEATVEDKNDGTYEVTYAPQEPAKITIDVTYEDNHIKDSPFAVDCKEGTDAENTGMGRMSFTIHATDRRGKVKEFGGDNFEVKFEGPEDGECEDECTDNGDGSYTCSYQISSGKWVIHVSINGKKIKGSPFKQRV